MPAVELGPIEGVAVVGGGCAFPRRTVFNGDILRQLWGTSDEERVAFAAAGIEESLGVRMRSWAHAVGTPLDHAREESSLDLAVAAARAALADAGISASALGLVICATSTPHKMTATLSAAVGAALGASCAGMDLRTGCAAGLFALATAALYAREGSGPVLLVGAETFSKVIPPGHKMAMLTLADGAGALVIDRREGGALLSAFLRTDGTLGRLVTTEGRLPPTEEEIARGAYFLSGEPDELLRELPAKYEEALTRALARAGIAAGTLDLYVPHQAGKPLIEETCRRIGIAPERCYLNIARHANVGVAAWMAALVEARAEGRIGRGARVAVAAVGGGMSWAAAVLRFAP
jgi:3-oxoacyl-[acyl-carrier-protein] synthase-3